MAVIGDALLRVRPDTSGFESDVTAKVGGAFKKAAAVAGAAFAAVEVGNFLKGAIDSASDLGETTSKVNTVFGDAASRVLAFGKSASTALGQSQNQALAAAGTFGNLLRSIGLTADQSADMSTRLVGLASDLASFNNVSPEEALDALRSGLVGETEPLKRFGVNLNEATLKAKAMALGLSDGKGVLDANAKAQAAYALILDQTKLAQGDFAKTSGGLANQQRILAARFEDIKAKIGAALLPAMTKLATFVSNNLIPAAQSLARVLGPIISSVGMFFNTLRSGFTENEGTPIERFALVLRDQVLPVVQRVGAVIVELGTRFVTFVQTILPQVQEAITHFVNVVRGAWQIWGDEILAVVTVVWNQVKLVIETVLTVVENVIRAALAIINGDWGKAWDAIKEIPAAALNLVVGTVRNALSLVGQAVEAALSALRRVWDKVWSELSGIVSGAISAVVGFVAEAPGRIARAAVGMFDGIKNAFRSAINFIIRAWNRLEFKIPGFDPPGPGPSFGGVTIGLPNIPELAGGGLIKNTPGGVLALLGEGSQDEAVFPLDRLERMIRQLAESLVPNSAPVEQHNNITVVEAQHPEATWRRVSARIGTAAIR